MRDIIWQQHSPVVVNNLHDHRTVKFSSNPTQYDQPERIHFVSNGGSHLDSIHTADHKLNKLQFIQNNLTSSIDTQNTTVTTRTSTTASSDKWSVAIDDNQNPQEVWESKTIPSSLTLNNSQATATTATMFSFENHKTWQEPSWSVGVSDGSNDKSEHAISQPITMVSRPRPEQYNNEQQSVTSPRSADGAVGLDMVEYVLASSPGGQAEIEARMKAMAINGRIEAKPTQNLPNGNVSRKSPFEEVDNFDNHSPQNSQGDIDESAMFMSGQQRNGNVSNSRNESPLPANTHQDMAPLGAIIGGQNSSKPSSTSSGAPDEQVTSPIPFVHSLDGSNMSPIDELDNQNASVDPHQIQNENISESSQQQEHAAEINNQQHFVFGNGQQMGMPSPYFMANASNGQDPYSGGVPIVNANGQTAVIHPQYAAAYGIQPSYVYTNQAGQTYLQQQPQQIGQQGPSVQSPTTSTANSSVQQQMTGQQISGYQVVQGPINFPAGSTFYDQHGNPVIINGRMATTMTNHLGQHVRMVSPVVLNANGPPTVSPGIASGTSPSMQMYGAQQQASQQQQQQAQQRPGMRY